MAKNYKQLSNGQELRSKNNRHLTLQQEQRLYELYKKENPQDIEFFDSYKSCENVVVFGQPGCGKSTVINSLLGHQLKSIPRPNLSDYLCIDLADPYHESQLKISHSYDRGQETLTHIPDKDITIWECTGLYKQPGGTKGIEYIVPKDEEIKMRESPRIMQLLKTVNSVKFIFVAHYNDLTVKSGRGEEFIATVDRIASIFSDLDLIKESILLVITKAPSLDINPKPLFMINDIINSRDMSDHTKKLMEYLTKSPIHIFYQPEKEGKVDGPTLELIQILPSCDVSQSIQYPGLSPLNQELALKTLAEDEARIQQEEEAKKQLEQAGVDTKNISNAWFFIKVIDFLYDALASISILTKAGQYAGGVLITLSSLIGINKLKGYFSSHKMEAVSEKDDNSQPMSPEKAKLAKCLAKILNENEALSKEFNQKFNECIERYTQCKNDEERQSIVKQFSEWIISETNLRNVLQDFEAEVQVNLEDDSSDGDSKTQYRPDMVKIKNNFAEALKKYSASNPNISTDTKQKFSAATLDAVSKIITADNTIIELKDNVYIEQALHDKTSAALDEEAHNPVESEGEAATEQALHDATSDETLDKEIHNIVESEGGGGDNLTSDDKNTADEPQEDNTTETNTVDEREGDGYDAGMHLGGEVNNPFDIIV
jgi:energy-coupling factor transporter ATP-binding protein EcfA2